MAKEKAPYMPFYGRDFYGDLNVMAMNAEQRGVYIHLLWLCWQEGAIPSDVATLAAVTGSFPAAYFQEHVWPKLCGLFDALADGKLVHCKVESIRDGNESFRKKRSDAGKAGAMARWGGQREPAVDGKAIATESQTDGKAIAKPWPSSSLAFASSREPKTLCSSGDERGGAGLVLTAQKPTSIDAVKLWFDTEFWPAYPRKVAKPQALKVARRHGKTAADRTAIMECLLRRLPALQAQFKTDGDYRPYPASWLGQTPWMDPEETARPVGSVHTGGMVNAIDQAMQILSSQENG